MGFYKITGVLMQAATGSHCSRALPNLTAFPYPVSQALWQV